jgi:hypothetical protein
VARNQQQPQRLASLPHPGHTDRRARQRRAYRTHRVERVVLAAQPPLVAGAATALEHRLTAVAQVTREAGAVMTDALNRPDTRTRRVSISEAQRLRATARARPYRPLRDQPAARRDTAASTCRSRCVSTPTT